MILVNVGASSNCVNPRKPTTPTEGEQENTYEEKTYDVTVANNDRMAKIICDEPQTLYFIYQIINSDIIKENRGEGNVARMDEIEA
jgi:hypothetical protein